MLAWLRLFLPIAALIGATLFAYGRQQRADDVRALAANEQARLQLAAEYLSQTLVEPTEDLRVIADTPAIQAFVASGTEDVRARTEPLLAAFLRQKPQFDQLRLLDAEGREVVRINRTPSGPRVVPAAELQAKQKRDYFTETLALPERLIRVSRLDLNIEGGVIERPFKPTLRLSMRLRAPGRPDYVLIANLRANLLLKGVRERGSSPRSVLWLLDDQGYWLLHPDPAMLWGFALDKSRQLQQRAPRLLPLLDADSGDRLDAGALYVHRRVEPLAGLALNGIVNHSPHFDLIASVDAEHMPRALPLELAGALAVLLALAAVGCALLVHVRGRAAQAEQRTRTLLEETASANEARAWIRERIYQFSLQVSASSNAASFGAAVLGSLAEPLGLVAARLYAQRQERSELLASFGLPADADTRSFAAGEGLVGEAARLREERRMTPPPAGYLDLATGMGRAPAADLRILPLWVHGRTVGVIEIALARHLPAREEELLRQVLPLLALNLDGFMSSQMRAA